MMRMLMAVMVVAAMIGWQPSGGAADIKYRPELLIQLGVADLDRAIAFYTDVLGFELTERRDDLRFAHLDTNVPGLQIGLSAVAEPRGTGGAVLNISVMDVAAARKTLEARGVSFPGETVVIPGKVALAAFADPDGNLLRLAGPPPRPRPAASARLLQDAPKAPDCEPQHERPAQGHEDDRADAHRSTSAVAMRRPPTSAKPARSSCLFRFQASRTSTAKATAKSTITPRDSST
jgi:catechol 2,3-dioxygenase-like lactoylglutathione lyase family enzyme